MTIILPTWTFVFVCVLCGMLVGFVAGIMIAPQVLEDDEFKPERW